MPPEEIDLPSITSTCTGEALGTSGMRLRCTKCESMKQDEAPESTNAVTVLLYCGRLRATVRVGTDSTDEQSVRERSTVPVGFGHTAPIV